MTLVLGIDVGGTHTRCLLADGDGRTLARGAGPGGNPNTGRPAEAIAAALTDLLVEWRVSGSSGAKYRATHGRNAPLNEVVGDPIEIAGVVVGAAGGGAAGRSAIEIATRTAADRCGVVIGELAVCTDCEAGFAAGSLEPRGTILIAGTGTVAAAIEDFAVVRRRDGHGYLLGDAGSAFWLATAAVRAVLSALEGAGADTALRPLVLEVLRADEALQGRDDLDDVQAVVAATYAHPPARLAALAPLVDRAAASGDAVARAIADDGVAALVRAVLVVRTGTGGPVVRTGGIACSEGYLGTRLRDELDQATGERSIVVPDGTSGAAALALRRIGRPDAADRLIAQASR